MKTLIVWPTLPGFGRIVAVDPPACYEPKPGYLVVKVTPDYERTFSTKMGDEVAYCRYRNNNETWVYAAVDPGTSGT